MRGTGHVKRPLLFTDISTCVRARVASLALTAILSAGLALTPAPATAHPHVFVTYETTIVYKDAMVTGIQHAWTFDDMYTAMAVQGLDKDGDGKYSREELAELAKINMEGLSEFEYFTYAKLADSKLAFAQPGEAWLEHNNGILRLHFKLQLEKPVFSDAKGLTFAIYDPTYFIAFEPEDTEAIKLASAPQGCKASFGEQDATAAAELERLGDAFAQELGGDTSGYSLGAPRTVSVNCAKS